MPAITRCFATWSRGSAGRNRDVSRPARVSAVGTGRRQRHLLHRCSAPACCVCAVSRPISAWRCWRHGAAHPQSLNRSICQPSAPGAAAGALYLMDLYVQQGDPDAPPSSQAVLARQLNITPETLSLTEQLPRAGLVGEHTGSRWCCSMWPACAKRSICRRRIS